MSDAVPLKLFNSLTRRIETFEPVHPGEARVYSCGPTVYNYPHIGNMRAYVFADTLGRTLSFKGYRLTHIINITDVGHLTDDADAGEDKMEKMAAQKAQSIWDIAKHYTEAYWADVAALNIRQPSDWTIATDYVPQMIEFAKSIAAEHCYELESGLYFDTSTVADYGRLARTTTDEGESRIDPVEGKRHAADFAIWRKTPAGETRQMEWDSPWGRGAPGWHLECSVMSRAKLGLPFDIHTGGIDHREIHHPNEIAQNQAIAHFDAHHGGLDCAENSGARVWMHNNFLVERSGKMSKSAGEFLRLQLLIDRGFHPLAYRLMCLQAHYRSELEFSWEILAAALTRLKRLVRSISNLKETAQFDLRRYKDILKDQPFIGNNRSLNLEYFERIEPIVHKIAENNEIDFCEREILLVITEPFLRKRVAEFSDAISEDLLTPEALTPFELAVGILNMPALEKLVSVAAMDSALGLNLLSLTRADLRIRPKSATLAEAEIEAALDKRQAARAAKDFAASDAIRDDLIAKGVEVMDGDPLRWDWKPVLG
jgi:cysteinyl-tRNA synthetase